MKRFLKYDTEITKKENSPVDKNGLIKENIVGGGSSVQSDWNQNDTTKPDYIKNRPFYTGDPVETVMLPETTVTIAEQNENLITSSFPYSFEVGQTYVITFDGVDTEYTAYEYNSYVFVGEDFSSLSGGSGYAVFKVNNLLALLTNDKSLIGSHTIVIKEYALEIVKIDAKYLPSDNAPYKAPIIVNGDLIKLSDEEKKSIYDAFCSGSTILWRHDDVRAGEHALLTYVYFAKSSSETLFKFTCLEGDHFIYYDSQKDYHSADNTQLSYDGISGIADSRVSRILQSAPLKYFVLASSTAASTKKFKITVDDSGAISATEVT